MLTLLACAILMHESVYISSHGFRHITEKGLPVLGLLLSGPYRALPHVLLIVSAVLMLWQPSSVVGPCLGLLALTVVIASFPRRVPNHLAVGWFLCLLIVGCAFYAGSWSATTALASGGSWGAAALLVSTYGIAGLHKLNRSFFDVQRSAGSGLLFLHCAQLDWKLPHPEKVGRAAIYGTVLAELTTPILFLAPALPKTIAVTLALGMILTFGLLGHCHFSLFMLAVLYGAMTGDVTLAMPSNFALLVGIFLGAVLVARMTTNYRHYRLKLLSLCNYSTMVLIIVIVALEVFRLHEPQMSPSPIAACIAACFVFNGLSPYMGLKQDFSLAMFSNLRPDRWDHWVLPEPKATLSPRYVRLLCVQGDHDGMLAHLRQDGTYSVGYIASMVRDAELSGVDGAPAVFVVDDSDDVVRIDRSVVEGLRMRDRLGLYPVWLPPQEEPYLG